MNGGEWLLRRARHPSQIRLAAAYLMQPEKVVQLILMCAYEIHPADGAETRRTIRRRQIQDLPFLCT